ncbi:hypothetical protein KOI91_21570 [Escherichia coli]|uniref:hypothetical protein n=1 Tax=Escherichia coli TaxID=562 RepID=UPI001CA42568|nr:hypothetical protein [Escherichia coli]MBY8789672.1 hypothetical protein [Escherichia coli]MDJ7911169.1 hypothetical protein [Salmonella enterica]
MTSNDNWNGTTKKEDEISLDDSTITISLSKEDEEAEKKHSLRKRFNTENHLENAAMSGGVIVVILGMIIYLPVILVMMTGLMIRELIDTVREW